jgi:uncharacterized RDD family membrane protein YckC
MSNSLKAPKPKKPPRRFAAHETDRERALEGSPLAGFRARGIAFVVDFLLMRIRVVSLTHPRLTLWQSIERALGYGASFLEGGFGFLQYFLEPNRQTVHDRIAHTIVVAEL